MGVNRHTPGCVFPHGRGSRGGTPTHGEMLRSTMHIMQPLSHHNDVLLLCVLQVGCELVSPALFLLELHISHLTRLSMQEPHELGKADLD